MDTDFHGFGRINDATTSFFIEPHRNLRGLPVPIRENPCPFVIDAASEERRFEPLIVRFENDLTHKIPEKPLIHPSHRSPPAYGIRPVAAVRLHVARGNVLAQHRTESRRTVDHFRGKSITAQSTSGLTQRIAPSFAFALFETRSRPELQKILQLRQRQTA